MNQSRNFAIESKCPDTRARTGKLTLNHGTVQTPVFMPVGTFGGVRHVSHEDLEFQQTQIILANAYHLYLRPGPELLSKLGGFHEFAHWPGPLLTDSGGFQIFSLPEKREIFKSSVRFKSYIDHAYHTLTPQSITEFQHIIGSDIMMVLDVCVPSTSTRDQAAWAMEKTHEWALASKQTFRPETGQLQFAICQGAIFEDLRRESAEFIASNNFDGHAIGGLAVGESKEEREHFTAFAAGLLPDAKPRYLMGVGTPHDLIRSVRAGIDMFDCIIPTNHAKQGVAYTWSGKVKLRRSVYADHKRPLEDGCDCPVCTRYSCAYLYQMFKSGEPAAWRYVSLHNLWFYKKLMSRTRNEIASGSFANFSSWFLNEVPEI
jgi:queuine tRNA-ribosyltransferase